MTGKNKEPVTIFPKVTGSIVKDVIVTEATKSSDAGKALIGAAKALSSNAYNPSISKMSRDMILQFPVIMSATIPTDDAIVIAKTLEKQYASLILLILSSTLSVDKDKYANVGEYIKELHNNDDAPNILKYAFGLTDNVSTIRSGVSKEATVVIPKGEIAACCNSTDMACTMESLNNKYNPTHITLRALEAAIELRGDTQKSIDAIKDVDRNANTKNSDVKQQKMAKVVKNDFGFTSSLEPTIISASIYVDKDERNFMLGVKAMVRRVSSDLMVANLVHATTNNQLAFKMIKWTKGELKFFRDIVFDITNSRMDANAEREGKGWFSALRRRKQNSKAFVGGGKPLSPISTLVMSTSEVEQVKASTGIDLYSPASAGKLISDLFLLALIIYDPSTKVVSTMMDGEVSKGVFTETTINGLKANNNKNTDLHEMAEVMKALGR